MTKGLKSFVLKNEKKILGLLIFIALIYIVFFISTINTPWAQDSHWHLTLAENSASGKGYSFDGENPHGKYPPGLTILIIPFYFLLKNIHLAGLVLLGILSVASLILTYKIGKLLHPLAGLLAVFLAVFSSVFVFYSTSVLTEIPFMFFSLLGLYLFIKGFEKNKYFLLAIPIIAFSCLIRYDGFFLIFPMIFYTFLNRNKFKKLIFSDNILIGISLGAVILTSWFLRNYFAFGNLFYTDYSQEIVSFSLKGIYTFLINFFSIGLILSILCILGIYFSIKNFNKKFSPFLIWFFVYIALHSVWYFKSVRFYTEVFSLIVIFGSYALICLYKKLKINKKLKLYIFSSIIALFLLSQFYLFFLIPVEGDNASLKNIDRYNSIKLVSDWSNKNLPDNANYLVSDYPTYSLYLNKPNILPYHIGINNLFQESNKTSYLFVDNHHPWATESFLSAETGNVTLTMNSPQGLIQIDLQTELLYKKSINKHAIGKFMNQSSCFVVEITDFKFKLLN